MPLPPGMHTEAVISKTLAIGCVLLVPLLSVSSDAQTVVTDVELKEASNGRAVRVRADRWRTSDHGSDGSLRRSRAGGGRRAGCG